MKIFFKKHQTQLIILILATIPTFVFVAITFVFLKKIESTSEQLITEFAEDLYRQQTLSKKIKNNSITFQLSAQVQNIAWKMRIINIFYNKIVEGEILLNNRYIPSILNIERASAGTEDLELTQLYHQNKQWVSSWYQGNTSDESQLYGKSKSQLTDSDKMSFLLRSLKYDFNNDDLKKLKINDIFVVHEYEGLTYSISMNKTYSSYNFDCLNKKDVRCEYYYNSSMNNPSLQIFSPRIFNITDSLFLSSFFCSRFLQKREESNGQSDISQFQKYSLLCATLDISQFNSYFNNEQNKSDTIILIDPKDSIIIFNSDQEISDSSITSIYQMEIQYLKNKTSQQLLINELNNTQNIKQQSKSSQDIIQLNSLSDHQSMFEYDKNGTNTEAILNIVSLIDKPMQQEIQIGMASKYIQKSAFIIMNLSKNNITQYFTNLQNDVSKQSSFFFYGSCFISLVIMLVDVYCAYLLGIRILLPVSHLTNILESIRFSDKNDILPRNSNMTFQKSNKINLKQQRQSTPSILFLGRSTNINLQKQYSLIKNHQFINQPRIEETSEIPNTLDQGIHPKIQCLNKKQSLDKSINLSIHTVNSTLNKLDTEESEDNIEQSKFSINSNFDESAEGILLSQDMQELFNAFQNMFKVLSFATQRNFEENESTCLLNLNKQILHFQQFGNHRALGVCHNNLGFIHFNCGRYKEAVEHFETSVLHAKYELHFYVSTANKNVISSSIKLNSQNFLNQNEFHPNEVNSNDSESITFQNVESKEIINNLNVDYQHSTLSSRVKSQDESKFRKLREKIKFFGPTKNQKRKKMMFSTLIHQSVESQSQGEREELYWNYYNRRVNYCKALLAFLKENSDKGIQMWEIFGEVATENAAISQLFLPHSNKREMMNYYFIAIAYDSQNRLQEASLILNRFSSLFLETLQSKLDEEQIDMKKRKSYQMISNLQSQYNIQNSDSLSSPQCEKSPFQITENQQNISFTQSHNNEDAQKINSQNENSQIKSNLRKSTKKLTQPNTLQKLKKKSMNFISTPYSKQQSSSSSSKFQNARLSLNTDISSQQENQLEENITILQNPNNINLRLLDTSPRRLSSLKNENAPKQSIVNQFQTSHSQITKKQTNLPSILDTSSIEDLAVQQNKISRNSISIIQNQEKQQLQELLRDQNQTQDEIIQKNHEIIMDERLKYHQNQRKIQNQELTKRVYLAQSSLKKRRESMKPKFSQSQGTQRVSALYQLDQSRQSKQNIMQILKLNSRKTLAKKTVLLKPTKRFFCVRKIEKIESMPKNEFSIDIIFFHYSILQAKFQLQRGNTREAAHLLTTTLEECELYLPHLKSLAFSLLNQIFQNSKLNSDDLNEMLCNSQISSKRQFEVIIISASKKEQSLVRTHSICTDFLKEILFKPNDQFGLITYDNKKKLFSNTISLCSRAHMKQAFSLFENILKDVLLFSFQLDSSGSKEEDILKQIEITSGSSSLSGSCENVEQSEENKMTSQISILYSQDPCTRRSSTDDDQIVDLIQNNKEKQQKICENNLFQGEIFNQSSLLNLHKQEKYTSNNTLNSERDEFFLKQDKLPKNYEQRKKTIDKYQSISEIIQNKKNLKNNIRIPSIQSKKDISYSENILNQISLPEPITIMNQFHQKQFQTQEESREEQKNDKKIIERGLKTFQKSMTLGNPNSEQNKQECDINLFKKSKNFLNLTQLPSQFRKERFTLKKNFEHHSPNLLEMNSDGKLKLIDDKFLKETLKIDRSSEEIFHLGIHTALKNFVLDTSLKLTNYYARVNNNGKSNKQQGDQQCMKKTFFIFIIDEIIQIKNKYLFDSLCQLLKDLRVELCITILDYQLLIDDLFQQDISIQSQSVIKFFSSEQKMLQYIYNQREHISNQFQPMIIEHF